MSKVEEGMFWGIQGKLCREESALFELRFEGIFGRRGILGRRIVFAKTRRGDSQGLTRGSELPQIERERREIS